LQPQSHLAGAVSSLSAEAIYQPFDTTRHRNVQQRDDAKLGKIAAGFYEARVFSRDEVPPKLCHSARGGDFAASSLILSS
jgi:hypothetical protein